jgi:hypothetical protein
MRLNYGRAEPWGVGTSDDSTGHFPSTPILHNYIFYWDSGIQMAVGPWPADRKGPENECECVCVCGGKHEETGTGRHLCDEEEKRNAGLQK